MSRVTDIIAATQNARHCTEYGCPKCTARARWNRRKKWSRKNPNRRNAGRK